MFFADCHGLISVAPWDKNEFYGMKMHAIANPQRFHVYGTLPLTKEIYESLKEMCNDEVGKKVALNAIKDCRYNLPVEQIGHLMSNMKRIPNDSLDPFWHDPKEQEKIKAEVHKLLGEQPSDTTSNQQ